MGLIGLYVSNTKHAADGGANTILSDKVRAGQTVEVSSAHFTLGGEHQTVKRIGIRRADDTDIYLVEDAVKTTRSLRTEGTFFVLSGESVFGYTGNADAAEILCLSVHGKIYRSLGV